MNYPNPPQQPGPYGPPPPGGQPPFRPQQPPPYGQQPPSYGQQPPPYGQPPTPPGGHQPPPYGQPPMPPGGQPPTPPGGQPPPPPYGQPQSDYPPPADYPPAPTGKPAKPSGKRRVIIAIVAIVVLGGGYLAYQLLNKNSASSADAGDCIKVNRASATSADVEKIDCNDNIAVFKVAKKLGNDTDECPTPDYEKYTQSGSGSDFALCLMLNAKEGDCFANYDTPDKRARVDCAGAEVKVAKLVSGTADEAACEQDSQPLVYPEPATTFCLAQP